MGKLVGAIAVVVTLAYLAVQVRQNRKATDANTRQMRGQAFVELNAAVHRLWSWLRDNPDHTEVILKAIQDWHSLNPEEQRLAMFWFGDETSYYELAFMLFQEGALDERSYISREEYFLSMLLSPGRRYWWDELAYLIDQRFRDRINDQVAIADKLGAKSLGERFPMYAPRAELQPGK